MLIPEIIGGLLLLSAGLHQHWGELVISFITKWTNWKPSAKISLLLLVAAGEICLFLGGNFALALAVNGFAIWSTVWERKQKEIEEKGDTVK